MPDLFDLPAELLDPILDYAYGPDTPTEELNHDPNERLDRRQLGRLLLVKRKWYQALLPRVYSSWSYNGTSHSYMSLFRFLRTILTSPHIAALVQTLNVGNWGHGIPFYLSYDVVAPSPTEEGLLSDAIRRAGIDYLKHEILEKVLSPTKSTADHRPLMALLVAHLPNLSTLYAHVPRSDPYLHAVLLEGRRRSTLGKLNKLYLLPEILVFDRGLRDSPGYQMDTMNFHHLKLDVTWPVLFLSGLRSVSIYNLNTEDLALLLEDQRRVSVCHVEQLRVVTHKQSKCLPEDVHALLTLPQALTRLSFYWHYYSFKHGPAKKDITWKVSNQQVWAALQQHAPTLQSLEIMHGIDNTRHFWKDHFGPLASFVRLKTLVMQPEILYGGDPSLMSNSLPAGLETLTLLINSVPHERLPELLLQLNSVVASTDRPLKQLWLGDRRLSQPDQLIEEPCKRLEATCTERSVRFTAVYITPSWSIYAELPSGSGKLFPQHWRRTLHLKDDGFKRLILEHKYQLKLQKELGGHHDELYIQPIWPDSFLDHRGDQGFTLYEDNDPQISLYPLLSFAVYFTHPAAGYPQTDMAGLFALLRQEIADFHFRLDVYFLPNASEEDCMKHYRAEKATRKRSHVALELFERRVRNRLAQAPCRPGKPEMVEEFTLDGRRWGGALCICPGRGWRENEERLCCLLFDSPEGGSVPVWREWLPISGTSPGAESTGGTAASWMWDLAYPFRDTLVRAQKEAMKREWIYWC
ncbi:hypothetical protein BJX63DRAFT_385345 [Aspergillus granulosus]|uniref:F-box domain-containing protein n=1 Tax=Aspergillus granulosus TaxID=176169 RepID=A0ABR4HT22_9EURO